MQPARSVTNDEILSIAAQHFSEKGLAGGRVDEIARLCGVNKATLYYRLGDKAALYHAILHKALEGVLTRVMIQVGNQPTVEEKLASYVRAIADSMQDQPYVAALIMREVASGSENMPAGARQRVEVLQGVWSRVLQQGVDEQRFKASDPALSYFQLFGTLLFYVVTESKATGRGEAGLAELVQQLTDSILLMLRV